MKRIIQITLTLLLSLGMISLSADNESIDIRDYKILLPANVSGWEAEDIETIKLGSEAKDILLHRMYMKGKVLIEVQITANYNLLQEVWSTVKNPKTNPDASIYTYKNLKGMLTKDDGHIDIEFLSGNERFIFGITLVNQSKLSKKELSAVVEDFLDNFDLSKLTK